MASHTKGRDWCTTESMQTGEGRSEMELEKTAKWEEL
jgi:hypothetical protein